MILFLEPWQSNPPPSAHCPFISLQTSSLAQVSSALFLTATHVSLEGWRRTLCGSNELTPKSLLWPFPSSPTSSHSPSFSTLQLKSGLLKLCDTLLLFLSKPSSSFHLPQRPCQILVLAHQALWPPPSLSLPPFSSSAPLIRLLALHSPHEALYLSASAYSSLSSCSHTSFWPLSISSPTHFLSLLQPTHMYLTTCLA